MSKNKSSVEISFPKEWELVNLGDKRYLTINDDSIDPAKAFPNQKMYYIDIDSVENGTGKIHDVKEILGENAPSRARRIVHRNDVIMSTVRPYLKAFAMIQPEFDEQICSTGFAVLRCKHNLTPEYLFFSLFSSNVINQCTRLMMGGQYPALNQSQVEKIKIPLPPLPEQKKIAQILTTVDNAIRKVDDAISRTRRLKKGLMQELLTRGIGHTKFKEVKGVGTVPEEWEMMKLNKIGEVITGKTPPTSNRFYWSGITPFITPGDISDGKYVNQPNRFLTTKGVKNVGRLLPKDTVIVVCIGSTIGKVSMTSEDSVTNQQINSIICNDSIANPFFLYYSMLKKSTSIKLVAGTAAVPIIKKSLFEQIKIPLPPLPEQKKIAGILSTVDRKIELERKRKEKLGRIKKGLMNDLLTGKIRVKLEVS